MRVSLEIRRWAGISESISFLPFNVCNEAQVVNTFQMLTR